MTQTDTNSPAVALFQEVHGKMVVLQRLDTQLAALIDQRHKVQLEITALQNQINGEIGKQLRESDELPTRILAEIAQSAGSGSASHAGGRLAEIEKSEPVSASDD